MDHNLELPFNEITVLMALSSIGIIAVLGLSIYVALNAFLGKAKTKND